GAPKARPWIDARAARIGDEAARPHRIVRHDARADAAPCLRNLVGRHLGEILRLQKLRGGGQELGGYLRLLLSLRLALDLRLERIVDPQRACFLFSLLGREGRRDRAHRGDHLLEKTAAPKEDVEGLLEEWTVLMACHEDA